MNCTSCGKVFYISHPNYCPYCSAPVQNRKPEKPQMPVICSNEKCKYFYGDVEIAASELAARKCTVGESILLEQESTNEYDSHAIRVLSSSFVPLGYLYKNKLQAMVNDYLEQEKLVLARVVFNDIDTNKITIALAFYKQISDNDIIKSFRITLSESKYDKVFSEGIYFNVPIGDEISVEFDYDKARYMVENWGLLPEKYEEYANDSDYVFFVMEETENDSGSHSIKIGIVERG